MSRAIVMLALWISFPGALAQVESNLPGAGFDTPTSAPTPTIHVYSRETIVDVTVTDDKGKPVHGLTRSDFTVAEDGAPQSLLSFEEFGSTTPAAAQLSPGSPHNLRTSLQPATGALNVLLFDDINGGDTGRARLAAAACIKSMAPGTQVAMLALGNQLTVLQDPTTDLTALLKAVNNLVEPFSSEGDSFVNREDYCAAQNTANRATLQQLDLLAIYLSGIKGRKNLIWIDSGHPSIIFPDPTSRLCLQDSSVGLRKAYDLLQNAQVTVYPVDPSGVQARLATSHLSLEAVAEATGGVAYYNRNDLDGLIADAVSTGSSYYTLSYAPRSVQYDGRRHAIGIKVARPGVHLVYRKEYYADDPTVLAHTTASAFTSKHSKSPTVPKK